MKRHGQCLQDRTCPQCGALTCEWCCQNDGKTCDNHKPPEERSAVVKVLVATAETQGERSNDFCHTVEGELVTWPALECSGESVDGGCGCRRALCGVGSLKATTTAKVVERTCDLAGELRG